jgi:hypothetical protein
VAAIPTELIVYPDVALLGAARAARTAHHGAPSPRVPA